MATVPQAATARAEIPTIAAASAASAQIPPARPDGERGLSVQTGDGDLIFAPNPPSGEPLFAAHVFESGQTRIPAPAHHEVRMAQHITSQVAEIARPLPDRPVELTLDPEELGRLRLSFSTEHGALHVNVIADRPETLDLLRRHIDLLAQDLRQIGYDELEFSFGGGGQASGDGAGSTGNPDKAVPNESDPIRSAPELSPPPGATMSADGMDLRM